MSDESKDLQAAGSRVTLVGFPTDAHSSFLRGAAGAPPAIRAALHSDAGNSFAESGLDVTGPGVLADAGDARMRDDDSDRATIEAIVRDLIAQRTRVLSLGGDHAVSYPIVRAHAAVWPELSVVHVDAHPDLYESFQGDRYSHACPFARILEDTSVRTLVQIGIRTMSDGQRPVAERYGVRMFGPEALASALDALPGGPVYLSIDIDALDPAFAPGVSHLEPGGLSVREVLQIVRAIPGVIVGADIVEYNPNRDLHAMTAHVAAKFVKEVAARLYADARRGADAAGLTAR